MKFIYSFLIFCGIAAPAKAQIDSTAKSSFVLAAIYGNTANYFGQTTSEKLPYILTYAGYNFKSGIYFSASGLKLINQNGAVSSVDLSGGYSYQLSKLAEGSFSYTRSFYQKDAPLLQAANENNVNGSFSISHLFTTAISADYAFGTQSDVFLTLVNSFLINLGSLIDENDLISIEPSAGLIAGSQRFYQTYTTEQKRRGKLLDPIFPGRPPEPETTTVETTDFGLLAYTLNLPLAYSRANYTIEAAYLANLAGKNVAGSSGKPVSIFNMSVYYQF